MVFFWFYGFSFIAFDLVAEKTPRKRTEKELRISLCLNFSLASNFKKCVGVLSVWLLRKFRNRKVNSAECNLFLCKK